jgi:hypothetical protein
VNIRVVGIQSHEGARSEKVITVGYRSREDRWIRTWDPASEPREKRLKNLVMEIVKSQESGVASLGISDLGNRWGSYSTS